MMTNWHLPEQDNSTDTTCWRNVAVRVISIVVVSGLGLCIPATSYSQTGPTNLFRTFIFSHEPLAASDWKEATALYNRQGQSEEDLTEELSPEGDPVDFRETPNAELIEFYLQQIADIQDAEGPYSYGLEESFMELGRLYQLDRLNESAIEMYEQSLHINRINLGLYNERQYVILDDLTASLLRNLNLDGAIDTQLYQLFLRKKLNEGDTEQRILAETDFNNWLLGLMINSSNYNIEINRKYRYFIYHLRETEREFDRIIRDIEKNYPEYSYMLPDLSMSLAINHYYLALFTVRDRHTAFHFNNDEQTNPEETIEQPRFQIRESYIAGKRALEDRLEYIQQSQSHDTLAIVNATLDLADWYQVFKNNFDSEEAYAKAYNMIESSDIPEKQALIEQIFRPDYPITVPDFIPNTRSFSGLKLDSQDLLHDIGYMDVSFRVDYYGTASRVGLVDTNLEINQDYYFDHLENNIESLKVYRPYLEDPLTRSRQEGTYRFYIYGVGDYSDAFVSAVQNDG